MIIDFNELTSLVPGEGLEQLIRKIGQKLGLLPSWSGRGADGGRDIIFTEVITGSVYKGKITWLVSCKDRTKSGQSVTEADLPKTGVVDKVKQHKTDGILLVTTTAISTGAKELLDCLDKSKGGEIFTDVWDYSDLVSLLINPDFEDIFIQFFPNSYKRFKGLSTLEEAIISHSDELPDDVINEVIRLIKPYGEQSLKGSILWPYNTESAACIDEIMSNLFIDKDSEKAVFSSEGIEFDAFITFLEKLHKLYPDECKSYLYAVIVKHEDPDVKFNAIQFLFDNYEINPDERINLATQLDNDALKTLYESEVIIYVSEELYENSSGYPLFSELDQISSATRIESIDFFDISFKPRVEDSDIHFMGTMRINAMLNFDSEALGVNYFPGTFRGFIDSSGIYLEDANVDLSTYYA